jgi:hypothetical protein
MCTLCEHTELCECFVVWGVDGGRLVEELCRWCLHCVWASDTHQGGLFFWWWRTGWCCAWLLLQLDQSRRCEVVRQGHRTVLLCAHCSRRLTVMITHRSASAVLPALSKSHNVSPPHNQHHGLHRAMLGHTSHPERLLTPGVPHSPGTITTTTTRRTCSVQFVLAKSHAASCSCLQPAVLY